MRERKAWAVARGSSDRCRRRDIGSGFGAGLVFVSEKMSGGEEEDAVE